VLERALGRLRREQEDGDRGRESGHLEGFLTGQGADASYREVAEQLGTTENAVKSSIHRLRQRFGQFLRAEIAETVSSPAEVDDEVKHLLGVIAPWGRPPS
jgi:RNA polymerase sigma-70 factor (ECF subfamily)